MKKRVLAIVCMIAFATVNAQDVKFGVKAGLNISSLNDGVTVYGLSNVPIDVELDNKFGFHTGITAEAALGKRFSIQSELLYTQLGAKGTNYKMSLDYLSIPVLAKYKIVKGFFFAAGPQFSFLLDESAEFVGVEFNPETEDFDVGVNVGLGYQFDSGISFNVNHVFGTTDIIDVSYKRRNNVFQVSLGYQF